MKANTLQGKIIVVTGGSSGIGRACVLAMARQGARVYALSRRAKHRQRQTGAGCIVFYPADINLNPEQTAADIFAREGRIDALVNAAGNGIAGALEDTSAKEARYQMETNFFGTAAITRAFLPYLRASRGRVLTVGSVAAFFGIPFQGYYSASKYALEGFCEALRNELRPFGVRVTLLEPGDTRTGFTAGRAYTEAVAENPLYREEFSRAVGSMAVSEQKGVSPGTVGRAAARLLHKRNPPVRKVMGAYKLLVFARRLMPDRFTSWVLYKMYNRAPLPPEKLWNFSRDVEKKNIGK